MSYRRMVPLRRLIELLGGRAQVGLTLADWDSKTPATGPQIAALAKWRVEAPPCTPRAVASGLIAVLVRRSEANLATPWQLAALRGYGCTYFDYIRLTYKGARAALDRLARTVGPIDDPGEER